MEFRAMEPDIEILGHGVSFVTAGFRILPATGIRFLAKHRVVPQKRNGELDLDLNGWYQQERWLAAFEEIAREVGPNVLFEIGRQLGLQAWAPEQMKDVRTALEFLDIGYHTYHRKAGRVMFDAATGTMLEGIGHYGCRPVPGQDKIISRCENPYPCRFDHGLLVGLTARFEKKTLVEHDDDAPCRRRGAHGCTYVITW